MYRGALTVIDLRRDIVRRGAGGRYDTRDSDEDFELPANYKAFETPIKKKAEELKPQTEVPKEEEKEMKRPIIIHSRGRASFAANVQNKSMRGLWRDGVYLGNMTFKRDSDGFVKIGEDRLPEYQYLTMEALNLGD